MRKFASLHYSRWTLKRKLFGYMLLLALLLLFVLACGLFLMGRFSSTQKNIASTLELQMEVFQKDMASYWEDIAVMSIDLSEDMTDILEGYLEGSDLSFSMLTDRREALTEVQEAMIEPAKQQLQQSNCSGAFIILDATVNSGLDHAAYSRSGLYLQKSGNDLPDGELLLYRGIPEVGKRHGIMPHRKWQLEFKTNRFPDYEGRISQGELPLDAAYRLTDLVNLPGTFEEAVLMTVPMIGEAGEIYGLCGLEVNKSYFKAHHAQPTNLSRFVCLLAKEDGAVIDADTGLSCGIEKGYYFAPKGELRVKELGHGLVTLSGDGDAYVGIVKEMTLSGEGDAYQLAVMIPKGDYDRAVVKGSLQVALLVLLLLFFSAVCCMYFSRKFLSPILKALEKLKSDEPRTERIDIPEIDDLFAFLEKKDMEREAALTALLQEKQSALDEKERLRSEYEEAQNKIETAQVEISRLAYSRKQEVDPLDYQNFLEGIGRLTQTERRIFEYYLSGMTVKEILSVSAIKESTLRYHNQNIYSKLGVHSLKQLLRYAALMQREDKLE